MPLTGAQQNQRRLAAQVSANRRRGTGTKAKNPLTPQTKVKEMTRRRSNQDAELAASNAKGQQPQKAALDPTRPIKMKNTELTKVLAAARQRGLPVKSTKDGGAAITLTSGKTLTLETM